MAYRWLSVNAIQDVRGISGLNLIELNLFRIFTTPQNLKRWKKNCEIVFCEISVLWNISCISFDHAATRAPVTNEKWCVSTLTMPKTTKIDRVVA